MASRGVGLIVCVGLSSLLLGCGGNNSNDDPAPRTETAQARLQLDATRAAPSVTPTSTPPMKIGDVVWASAIDTDTAAPTDTVNSFPSDTQTIYAVLPVSNVPENLAITADWTYNDTPLESLATTITIAPGQSPQWIEFHLSRSEDSWPDGDYAIAIRIDGETIQQADVTIDP